MLQRSFRYFNSENPIIQGGSAFVFSHCDFSDQLLEIRGFMRIEPSIQAVQLPLAYVITLNICSPAMAPGTVLTPPLEVVTQLRQIMCFYFDAFFGSSADEVRLYSAASPSLPHVYATDRPGDKTLAKGFPSFLRKLLRLNRKAYVAVQRCMAAHEHALLSLLHHPELAYSLFVFGLESLVQEFDNFTPRWSDLAHSYRGKLDKIMAGVDSSTAESLREAITESQHLKLQQRVLAFASRHIPDSYFSALGGPPSPRVRKSTFDLALKGAYDLRSRYAHALMRSEDIQRKTEIVVIHDDSEDRRIAFTILGLQRLFRQVVWSFIAQQSETDDPFVYEGSVERPPGSFRAVSPEYWLKDVQGLTAESARYYLDGLLYSYDHRILRGQLVPEALGVGPDGLWVLTILPDSPPNLELLGRRAKELLGAAPSKSQRNLLIAIAVLCGAIEKFEHGHVPKCTPEILAATVARAWSDSPWTTEQIDSTVNLLLSRATDVIFPDLMELSIMFYVSFAWHKNGSQEKAMDWLRRATVEASSHQAIQTKIEFALSVGQLINPFEIFKPFSQSERGIPGARKNDAGDTGEKAGITSVGTAGDGREGVERRAAGTEVEGGVDTGAAVDGAEGGTEASPGNDANGGTGAEVVRAAVDDTEHRGSPGPSSER